VENFYALNDEVSQRRAASDKQQSCHHPGTHVAVTPLVLLPLALGCRDRAISSQLLR
jgi:hypothetical protein